METNKTVRDLCLSAAIEYKVVNDGATKHIVSLNDEPVLPADLLNPDRAGVIRSTTGAYFVKYNPPGAYKANPKYPFIVYTDMVGFRLQVSGPEHFRALRGAIPEVDWLFRNTNYSPALFYWAKRHPAQVLYFTLNIPEYCDKIMEKAKKQGIDTKYFKPLVTFKFRQQNSPFEIHIDDTMFRQPPQDAAACKRKSLEIGQALENKNKTKTKSSTKKSEEK